MYMHIKCLQISDKKVSKKIVQNFNCLKYLENSVKLLLFSV